MTDLPITTTMTDLPITTTMTDLPITTTMVIKKDQTMANLQKIINAQNPNLMIYRSHKLFCLR
jgi:hypothetical protein